MTMLRLNPGKGLKRHNWSSILMGIGLATVWLSVAWDGRLHWDEPSYLYTGAYLSVGEILAGEFEPSRIDGFTFGHIGHILLIHLITSLTGPGMAVLGLIIGCYVLLLIAFAWVAYLNLRTLTPSVHGLGAAVALLTFSPLYVYLAFKTLTEIPALLLASVSVLAFLRSLAGRPAVWLTVTALALAVTGLFRPVMGLMFLSLVAALALCYRSEFPLSKIIGHALLSGLASLAIFLLSLRAMGIPVQAYLAYAGGAATEPRPIELLIFHTALEGGLLFMALPLAFISTQKRTAVLYAAWFTLATLPLLLLFQNNVEARYLAPNLTALAGLIGVSIDGLAPRVHMWWAHSKTAAITVSSVTAAALIASAALAQPVMHYGVHMHELSHLLHTLDQTYGQGNYAILTPDEFAGFHYIRVAYPERKVYTAHSRRDQLSGRFDPRWPALQQRFYGPRAILTIDQLAGLEGELVYVGFREAFPVANLRAMVRWLSWTPLPQFVNRQLEKIHLNNHFAESWMWEHPQLQFSEVARSGQYEALRVEITSTAAKTSAPGE